MMTSGFCFIHLTFKPDTCQAKGGVFLVFKIDSVQTSVSKLVHSPPRLLITSVMIWTPYDLLHKSYSFYVAAVVSIITKHGLSIDACQNPPNKHTLALYKLSIHFNNGL